MKKLIILVLCGFLVLIAAGCVPVTLVTPTPSPEATTPPPVTTLAPPQTGTVGEVSSPAGYIARSYAWEYGGRRWSIELQIPESLYSLYKEIPRLPTTNYSVYITHPLDDLEIGALADDFSCWPQIPGGSPRRRFRGCR